MDVVVHELTHSWFGNSITYVLLLSLILFTHGTRSHANASHFWLNEGWTTYMERVLQEKIHDEAERGFSYIIGRKQLDDALKGYEDTPKYQRLVIPFNRGENPDDAYSVIPYEKGSNFLLHLGTLTSPCIADVCLIRSRADAGRTRRVPTVCEKLRGDVHRPEHHNGHVEGPPV